MKYVMALLCCCVFAMAQEYRIVGPENPKPYEKTAVDELTEYLGRRISGNISVGGKSPVTFHVGDSAFAAGKGMLSESMEDERWVIKSFDRDVVLNGGGTRGALYAVYHFLEDLCDIHWWSEYEDYVPEASSLRLPALDRTGKPVLIYRDLYGTQTSDLSARNAIRNRLNRCGDKEIPARYGGSFNYGPPYHCHVLDRYLPAAKYLKDHPEWYSLQNGKRVGGQSLGQLCLSNPEIAPKITELVMKNIAESIEKAKKDGVPAPKIYDLSQNDNGNYCQCDKCSEFAKEHNQSGLYMTFINSVAREVAKVYPEVYITYVAYQYTEEPPKGLVDGKPMHTEPNVIVRITNTTSNHAVSVLHPDNKFYKDIMERWGSYSDIIFGSDYSVVFGDGMTGLPFPSEFNYSDLFNFLVKNKVRGSFWEHEYPEMADMYELKYFLECKLMEDPSLDQAKLMNMFARKYYGPAGKYILEYRKELNRACLENKGKISWFPKLPDFSYITDEDIISMQAIFDKAVAEVQDDALLLARVNRARLGLDRLICKRNRKLVHYGRKTADVTVTERIDVQPSIERLRTFWPKWSEKYPGAAKIKEAISRELENYTAVENPLPAPELFKDREFYDFYTSSFEIHDRGRMKIVEDAESETGKAVRVDVAKLHYYNMPFAIGFCDSTARKDVMHKTYDKIPDGAGYHWFNMGTVEIPQFSSYVYVTRAWTIQIPTGYPELRGQKIDVWVSAKHVGPQFHKEQEGPEYIYVDRIILAKPQE